MLNRVRSALCALLTTIAILSFSTVASAQNYSGSANSLQSALSTTVVTVKGSQGVIQYLQCYNPDAAVSYVQIFDTTGTVTLGTTAPTLSLGFGATTGQNYTFGTWLHSGIKVAATTTPTGSTAPTTALVCNVGFN